MWTIRGSVKSGVLQLPVRGLCSAAFNRKSLSAGLPADTLLVRTISGVRTPSGLGIPLSARTLFRFRSPSGQRTLLVLGMPSGFGTLTGVQRLSGLGTGVQRLSGLGTGVQRLSDLGTGVRRLSSGAGADRGAGSWSSSLVDSAPVHLCEQVLVGMQQASGLPWWLNIVVSTLVVRTLVTLPLATYQMVVVSKVEALQAEISELAKRLRYEVSVRARERGWTEKQSRFHFQKNLRRIVSQLYVRDNCHPFKASLLVWVQLPLWISLSLALRNLSLDQNELQAGLKAGGALWFPDLTLPDSTWILPVCVGLTNLLIVEVFSLQRVDPSGFQKLVTNSIRAFSVLMIPIAASVPSSMSLYWFTSSLVGLGQNLLLRSPAIHKVLKLQVHRSESPYRDLLSAFNAKYCRSNVKEK